MSASMYEVNEAVRKSIAKPRRRKVLDAIRDYACVIYVLVILGFSVLAITFQHFNFFYDVQLRGVDTPYSYVLVRSVFHAITDWKTLVVAVILIALVAAYGASQRSRIFLSLPAIIRELLTREDLINFTKELAKGADENKPLVPSLTDAMSVIQDATFRRAVEDHVLVGVGNGMALDGTLNMLPQYFPKGYSSAIRYGHETGNFSTAYHALVKSNEEQLARDLQLIRKIGLHVSVCIVLVAVTSTVELAAIALRVVH